MTQPSHRSQEIPAGPAVDPVGHIQPILDFLDENALPVMTKKIGAGIDPDSARGFKPFLGRKQCIVGGVITPEIWAALNERLGLPRTITFTTKNEPCGAILDEVNLVEIVGEPPRPPEPALDQIAPDGRLIIPGGTFRHPVPHLYPIAEFLRDAGLPLTAERPAARRGSSGYLGFLGQQDGWRCFVGGPITPAIWAALNEQFVLPRNLVYWPAANTTTGGGMIRDNDKWVDIIGSAKGPPGARDGSA